MGKRLPKKPKLIIEFNEAARKDFLTGFRKRKNERRKRAKVELDEMVKNERKRIREEVKNGVNKLKKSYAPLPLEDDIIQQENIEEDDDVIVKITELTTKDINQNFLGQNHFSDSEEENSFDKDDKITSEEIPGMSLKENKKRIQDNEKENNLDNILKFKKDIDKMKQKRTLAAIKNSKVFKMKGRVDRLENKKLAKRQKNKNKRELKSQGRRVEKKPDFRKLNRIRGKNPHKRRK